jgi:hypothetical protein
MDPGPLKGKINVIPSVFYKSLNVRTPKKRIVTVRFVDVGPLRSKLLTKVK